MDPTAIAGMIFTLILAALIGGFILLIPVSRRVGLLLEEKVREKRNAEAGTPPVMEALLSAIQDLEKQVRHVAERQEFTERLLSEAGRSAPRLAESTVPPEPAKR